MLVRDGHVGLALVYAVVTLPTGVAAAAGVHVGGRLSARVQRTTGAGGQRVPQEVSNR